MTRHGPVAWRERPEKAIYRGAVLEQLGQMALILRALDSAAVRLPDHLIPEHSERTHDKNAYYGQK